MKARALRPDFEFGFTHVIGVGGIGAGVIFQLDGQRTLGRNESRPGHLLAGRDYCKLHIVEHYIATLMGANTATTPFRVSAIGVLGDDEAGRQLIDEMKRAGIGTEWVRQDAGSDTLFSVCFVYPDGSGGNITASNSAAATLGKEDIQSAAKVMKDTSSRCAVLCLPEIPLHIRREFLSTATECRNWRVASFALEEIKPAQELNLFSMIDFLALNKEEASAIVGYTPVADNMDRFLVDCSSALRKAQPNIQIVISAGADGAYAFDKGEWSHYPVPSVSVASTAGAGDALLAGIISGLTAGLPLTRPMPKARRLAGTDVRSALELGVLLAAFSVTSPDTIHSGATLDRLEDFALSIGTAIGNEVKEATYEYNDLGSQDGPSRSQQPYIGRLFNIPHSQDREF
jgi:sugar/nucleoside kinase (ribokinase family)